MKIKKITLEDNPIFGQKVEFDFTKDDGTIYDNIILIGENGSGKSTLLDIIFQFSNYEVINEQGSIEKRIIEIELSDDELLKIQEIQQLKEYNKHITFTIDLSLQNWSQIKSLGNGSRINGDSFYQIKEIFKSIYSTTEINFNGNIPNSSTNKEIDEQIRNSQKSSNDLATQISQLLIDISVQDNADDKIYMKTNIGVVLDHDNIDKRTRRFQRAFSNIFKNISYKGIINLKPIFQKGSNEFDITKLSSGEKQIVFRGGFLLKDQNSLKGAPVLIDEPEISLHPSRQLNILNYYRTIFTDPSNNQQTSQILFTTHSPYVLKSYNSDQYKIFIFSRDEQTQKVNVIPDSQLGRLYSTPTWGEINRYAYGLATIEFHDELYGYLHEKYINGATDQNEANKRSSQINFEQEFLQKEKSLPLSKVWTREFGGISHNPDNVTLQTFIRNKTHHPENKTMQPHDFTLDELKQSIDEMIKLI